jgi:uncharacterized protein YrrD
MDELGPPMAYLTIEDGLPVFASDGTQIGAVEHVLADEDADIFDGLIIDTRGLLGAHRFADADQIDALHERGVVLRVGADALHEPSENPAALSVDPGDEEESPLASRLRRAWDWISGNY